MKKHSVKVSLIALFLAFALALSGCSCILETARDYVRANTTEEPTNTAPTTPWGTDKPSEEPVTPSPEPSAQVVFPEVEHGKVKFSDMEFVYPDVDAFIADIDALQADIDAGADKQQCLERYEALCERFDSLSSMASLAFILYCLDVTDEQMQANQEQLSNAGMDIEWRLVDVGLSLVEDPTLSEAFSSDYVESLRLADGLNDESIQTLVERENKLESEYSELLTTFTITANGREWTQEDISEAGDRELLDVYCSELNAKAGQIFLQLVDVRNEMALALGYDNYTDYAYDCFGRDFTPEQSKALAKDVKEYIVPLYMQSIFEHYDSYIASFETKGYSLQPSLDTIKAGLEQTVPELLEAWDYMFEYELYNFDVSDVKRPGSYSTIINDYNAPFMYTHWDGTGTVIGTIIHEFGHYANFYFNPETGWNMGGSLDLAEVDSQGLELLMLKHAASLYGEEYTDAMSLSAMLDAMYALMSACMEDEFQQWAYTNPDATLEQLNAEYFRLAQEYNFALLYGYTGTEWSLIHHHFEDPLYYISYGTSMLGALQVWDYSVDDYEGACDIYMQIQARPHYSQFRETLVKAGLNDPFASGIIADIADSMDAYVHTLR